MLLNYQKILLGLSAISSVLCDDPQDPYHGISISDSSDTCESLGHERPFMAKLALSSSTTAVSTSAPADHLPVFMKFFDDLDDEGFTSLSTPQLTATQKLSNTSTSSTTSPSFTTTSVSSSTGSPNAIQVALDWLTSTTNSTSSDDKTASTTPGPSISPTSPRSTTTTTTTTTSMTTTDPAKAALDWLTSGLDDKSVTAATTTDLKQSSVVSSIVSGLEATHTSAATANTLRPGFWGGDKVRIWNQVVGILFERPIVRCSRSFEGRCVVLL